MISTSSVFFSLSNDIYYNLGFEHYLADEVIQYKNILFLWQNSPCVIVGRNQNVFSECNLKAITEDGVKLARRKTGGGAVYHDMGNACFTFISERDDFSKEKNNKIVLNALKLLNIDADVSGRNDITVDGKKVSGCAFEHYGKRVIHHGTMLLNSKLDIFSKYLTPSKSKLEKHFVSSVESRVANINRTPEAFFSAISNSFSEQYGNPDIFRNINLDENDYGKNFRDENWIFGKKIVCTNQFETTINGEKYKVLLDVKDGKVSDCVVYTDSLDSDCAERIRDGYIGKKISEIRI